MARPEQYEAIVRLLGYDPWRMDGIEVLSMTVGDFHACCAFAFAAGVDAEKVAEEAASCGQAKDCWKRQRDLICKN